MKFDLKRPCAKCPFRTDVPPYLPPERAEEILMSITIQDATFACHETTEFDDEGDPCFSTDEQHCAGAMILLEKMGQANQLMRIAERLGGYDRNALHMNSAVYDDDADMLTAYENAEKAA